MAIFEQVIAYLLLGLGAGALISGVGLGVLLSYRGGGVINISTGCIAMLCGFCYWALRTGYFGITFAPPWGVFLTLVLALVLGLFFELLFVRPLRRATPLAKLVATLGFLLSAQAVVILAFGESGRPQPSILPNGDLTVFSDPLGINTLWIFGIVLAMTMGCAALYRWTKFGLGTRAAAESEASAALLGLSPQRYSLVNTMLMAFAMGVVGLIAASIQEVDSQTLPLLVVPALTAAMFGSFTSFPIVFIAGIGVGMIESLLTYLQTFSWFPTAGGQPIPGVQELLIFVFLVIAMLFRAGKIPGRGEIIDRRLPAAPRPKAPLRNAIKWGVPGAFAMWVLPAGFREGLISSLISAIALLSLVVIAGYVGQLSVVQIVLGGVTGFIISHFFANLGIGFPWSAIIGVLAATGTGIICGFPALRVRGIGLVVITLAATDAIQNFWFANGTIGAGDTGSPVPAPSLFGFSFGPNSTAIGLGGGEPTASFGWFCLIVLALVALFVCNLRRSRLGQEMLAVRSNERAAAATGINIRNIKLVGFALASAIAGISGALLAYNYGSITADSYGTTVSLALIAFGYIVGITNVPGAIQAAIGAPGGLFAFALLDWWGLQGNWLNFVGGFLLVLTLIHRPGGVSLEIFYGPPKKPFPERPLGRLLVGATHIGRRGGGLEGSPGVEEPTAGATV